MTLPLRVLGLSSILILAASCSATPAPLDKSPLGVLPTAVTSAEPLWIPFQVRAGKPASTAQTTAASPLQGVRQLTFDGHSGAGVFTPDGHAVIFETGAGGGRCHQLVRLDLQSGRHTTLELGQPAVAAPTFAGEGKQLAFSSSDAPLPCSLLGLESADFANGTVALRLGSATTRSSTTVAYPLAQQGASNTRRISGNGHQGWPTLTPDGSLMIFGSTRDGDPELYASGAGQAALRLTHSAGFDGGARLSPDGGRLVWHAEAVREEGALEALKQQLAAGVVIPRKLVVMLAGHRGQHPRPIATFGRHSAMPAFAPDSRHVLFASDHDHHGGGSANFDVYRIDPDGPATSLGHPRLERLTHHQAYDGAPSVSPDGAWLLFTSSRGAAAGQTNLFVARLPQPEAP